MKCVILAGGKGTRLGDETIKKPKPLVEIGGFPLICHIMNRYSLYGINDFIICAGYKGNSIKEYFKTFLEKNKKIKIRNKFERKIIENSRNWNVNIVNTGQKTMTGGRIKKIEKYLDDESFCLTYGDTLNDLNISKLIQFHKSNKALTTLTACHPIEKYGILKLKNSKVVKFQEKPFRDDMWVNGGYFVVETEVLDYINGDSTVWESGPMEKIVKLKKLNAFRHSGFYQSMDTKNEKKYLEKIWISKKIPWMYKNEV
jgi:glucose-1-phosphate cytidylyltransferase